MSGKRERPIGGIQMKWVSYAIAAAAVILAGALMWITMRINESYSVVQSSPAHFTALLRSQRLLIILFLLLVLVSVFLTLMLIIRPLLRNVRKVREEAPMTVTGAYEMRFLADSYNEIYLRSQQDMEHLSYEASHDPLTGALNRRAYERVLAAGDEASMALILIDVDYFRSFNNTYGHEMGDKVLKRVVRVVRDHFRSDDCICRIGGDEFVVLMRHMHSGLRQLVADKMHQVAEALRVPEGDVPSITLSVGVAFGDTLPEPGSLFRCADQTQYVVKNGDKNGYNVYDPETAGPEAAGEKGV